VGGRVWRRRGRRGRWGGIGAGVRQFPCNARLLPATVSQRDACGQFLTSGSDRIGIGDRLGICGRRLDLIPSFSLKNPSPVTSLGVGVGFGASPTAFIEVLARQNSAALQIVGIVRLMSDKRY
jgi:hypothetical protein